MRKSKEENKKQKSRKAVPYNIPMTMACVLFCLTLLTTHFTGGLYARYVATDSAADAARVAKFNVGHELKNGDGTLVADLTMQIVPGVYEYSLDIINNSEVDVNCTISVENTTDNLPLVFAVYKKDGTEPVSATDMFAVSADVEANSGKNTYIVAVTFPQENSEDYINKLDVVQLSIFTEQKD